MRTVTWVMAVLAFCGVVALVTMLYLESTYPERLKPRRKKPPGRVGRVLRHVANDPRRLLQTYGFVYVLLSELYGLVEHKGPIESLWWGVVTGSTVGYGDQYPASTIGRAIGVTLIVISIAVVAMLTSQLTTHMLTDPDAWTDSEQRKLLADVEEILTNQRKLLNDRKDASDND